MQTLDVISVNVWQILISLLNLFLLFLIFKKFLFKPVTSVLEKRQSEMDEQYESAANARREAEDDRKAWEETLAGAHDEADAIIASATESAKYRAERMISDAKDRADGIIRAAETEADLERRRAEDDIKREIVEVSEAIAEKLLKREVRAEDHRDLIDSVLEELGEQ